MKSRTRGQHGFTLIELTVVLALAAVLMGLVVVRLPWASTRQEVISEARKIGNLIVSAREQAMREERLFALRLDIEAGRYTLVKPQDRTPEALEKAVHAGEGSWSSRVNLRVLRREGTQGSSLVTLFFDAHGILPPNWTLEVADAKGHAVTLRLDPLVNEVAYDER